MGKTLSKDDERIWALKILKVHNIMSPDNSPISPLDLKELTIGTRYRAHFEFELTLQRLTAAGILKCEDKFKITRDLDFLPKEYPYERYNHLRK